MKTKYRILCAIILNVINISAFAQYTGNVSINVRHSNGNLPKLNNQVTNVRKVKAADFSVINSAINSLGAQFNNAKKEYMDSYNSAIEELSSKKPNYELCLSYLQNCIVINRNYNDCIYPEYNEMVYSKIAHCYHNLNKVEEEIDALLLACKFAKIKSTYAKQILSIKYNDIAMYMLMKEAANTNRNQLVAYADTIINNNTANNNIMTEAYYYKAEKAKTENRFDEAITYCSLSLDYLESNYDSRLLRSFSYIKTKNYEEALKDLNYLILSSESYSALPEYNDIYSNALYLRGMSYLKLSNKKQAKRDLKQASKLGNINAKVELSNL